MRIGLIFSCLLSTAFTLAVKTPSADPLKIGSRLELFVDDYLIGSLEGLELKLYSPRAAERVLTFDKPWEGVTSDYISVLKDDDRYRMYYRGSTHAGKDLTIFSELRPGESVIPDHREWTCYAESRDGITWTCPSLGLFEFEGSKDNNIVWTGAHGDASHCFMVFKDGNPGASADQPLQGARQLSHPWPETCDGSGLRRRYSLETGP